MKFRLYREHGSLNSKPVFDAFEQGLKNLGFEPSLDKNAIPVIWSVLWNGRMASNKYIYDTARSRSEPVVVLEVGGIKRGTTWKVGLNGINRDAFFGADRNSSRRCDLLGLRL